MMRKKLILTLFCVLVAGFAMATTPKPCFRNFTPAEYGAMSQNWSVAQDSLGYVYVGNNACLLRFNGKGWEKFYPLGKEAVIRSLYAYGDRLYLGSFQDFGYVEYDAFGNMQYTSLYSRLESSPDESEEFWYITRMGKHVFFIYFTSLYIYDTETGALHREVAPSSYFYPSGDRLVLASGSGMARSYDGCSFSSEAVSIPAQPERIVKMFPGPAEGTRWAVSATRGLFLLEEGKARRMDSIKWDVANRAIQCSDGSLVVGFLSSGVYAFGPSGEVLWHIGAEDGLLDNTVLSLLEDRSGNIWCALDKGLAVIYKGGDRLLSLSHYNLGKISVSLWDGSRLFVGSNQGLCTFTLDTQALSVSKVADFFPNSHLWSLYRGDDGGVFIGENSGTYVMDGKGAMRMLSQAPGGTELRAMTLRDGTEVLVQGSFTRLYLYKKVKDAWTLSHEVEGFMHPVRHLEVAYLGNVWLEHMYRGMYKVVLSEDGSRVSEVTAFPLDGGRLCKMGGRVLFHNKEGFWYYDEHQGRMAPFEPLQQLGLGECRRVIPSGKDLYWVVRQEDATLLKFHADRADVLDRLHLGNLDVSMPDLFESIIPLQDSLFLLGVENGFLVHDLCAAAAETPRLHISSLQCIGSGEELQLPLDQQKLTLPHHATLQLSLAATGVKYLNPDIRYQLSSYDYQPRKVETDMRIAYSYLSAGTYVFRAWLADAPDTMLIELPVVVRRSVFASFPALLLYVLMFMGLIAGIYVLMRRRMDRKLLSLRNEQLEASILLKSKELATYSLIEATRSQVLDKLKKSLARVRYQKDGVLSKAEYEAMQTIIREGEFSQGNWDLFYTNFDLIHKSFFRTLQERHPDLTPRDLRICAYLRHNMSTKELSSIMGVSIKGAEAARYRLRKKFSLPADVTISEYLSSLS